MMMNYYSGQDRGNEALNDGINLRLPSGKLAGLRQHRFRRQSDHLRCGHRSGRPVLLRHLHHRRHHRRHAAGQLRLRARSWRCCRGSTASASSTACMSRFFKFAIAGPNGSAGAVPVHRQRRQPGGQPDHADRAGRAGHRRALRHRRRLLQVPHRRQAAPRRHLEADQRQQARRRP